MTNLVAAGRKGADKATRPHMRAPAALAPSIERVEAALQPLELWLFGSRARGDSRLDSDWDILAVLPDTAGKNATDPLVAWDVSRSSDVQMTLLTTTMSELDAVWGLPNTIGYDLAHEGIRLIVD